MPIVDVNGHGFSVETAGPADGKPLLLVSGLGAQLTRWTGEFVDLLVTRGFRVVRMDNRDSGLSWGPEDRVAPPPAELVAAREAGRIPEVPYRLEDMAADAVGVLDALGIDKAHVAGSSMGGMIVQIVAAAYPERVLSLTSIMSTTGHPEVIGATEEAMAGLIAPRPDAMANREAYLDAMVAWAASIGSPAFPEGAATARARINADVERAFRPAGFRRQFAAIWGSEPRDERLTAVRVPAMVVHGVDDPLVGVAGGRATAEAIPGCELLEIPGMGHDIPAALEETVADAIARTAARVTS